jgi:hypothetical protein
MDKTIVITSGQRLVAVCRPGLYAGTTAFPNGDLAEFFIDGNVLIKSNGKEELIKNPDPRLDPLIAARIKLCREVTQIYHFRELDIGEGVTLNGKTYMVREERPDGTLTPPSSELLLTPRNNVPLPERHPYPFVAAAIIIHFKWNLAFPILSL